MNPPSLQPNAVDLYRDIRRLAVDDEDLRFRKVSLL